VRRGRHRRHLYAGVAIHVDGCSSSCTDYTTIFRSADAGLNWSGAANAGHLAKA